MLRRGIALPAAQHKLTQKAAGPEETFHAVFIADRPVLLVGRRTVLASDFVHAFLLLNEISARRPSRMQCMSPVGTSRRFAVTHRLGRYWRHSGQEWPRRLSQKCRD
jgi:hypothetical protein